ncbi:hypothetical protein AAFF_G00036430 [Aldrovandia affinis]|uniref:Uncharacterized protein n=1 Tax=Aldrovandia affinis TaxID=143900 RepID=A0AAD7WFK8_9TELE|nr:hypothetical protein AAFF_G00036430 [Aldrovandia affinis]
MKVALPQPAVGSAGALWSSRRARPTGDGERTPRGGVCPDRRRRVHLQEILIMLISNGIRTPPTLDAEIVVNQHAGGNGERGERSACPRGPERRCLTLAEMAAAEHRPPGALRLEEDPRRLPSARQRGRIPLGASEQSGGRENRPGGVAFQSRAAIWTYVHRP